MNIRDAILAAADHIERDPTRHNWRSGYFSGNREAYCPLCWIGHFLGMTGHLHSTVAVDALGVHHDDFYERCSGLIGLEHLDIIYAEPVDWVVALRLYADKFHAESADDTRFWSRVDKSAGPSKCWPWTGYVGKQGYGRLKYRGSVTTAHRLAFTLVNGAIPVAAHKGDVVVMHACDNRVCCNPAHLSIGTNTENVRDAATKGSYKPAPGSRRGSRNSFSKLTEAQVAEIKALLRDGRPRAALAARFGVGYQAISAIASGRNWEHVHPAEPVRTPDWMAIVRGDVTCPEVA